MDILKVLSRGTKSANRTNSRSSTSQLPSEGTLPNPQFFHDDAGRSGSKKRKRAKESERKDEEDEEIDVDYFAPKKEDAPQPVQASPVARDEAKERKRKRKAKLLDEDECRQILKSHRLKFTILSGRSGKPEAASKGKKNKKEKKAGKEQAAVVPPKEDLKQLFPQPLNSFPELRYHYDIPDQLAENVTAQGFRVPTEVQMGSLPLLLKPSAALSAASGVDDLETTQGVDFMAVAPTGSGKTISFLIPVLSDLVRRKAVQADQDEHPLEAIVLAPTRELAGQIVNEGRKLAVSTLVRLALMKKGMRVPAEEQVQKIAKRPSVSLAEESESEGENDDEDEDEPAESDQHDSDEDGKSDGHSKNEIRPATKADILVTTPKLLLNFLTDGKPGVKKTLPSVRFLILDEADVLLDPLFRKQTMGIWKSCTNPDLHLSCWSATMASNVEAIITTMLSKRAYRFKKQSKPFVRLVVGLKDAAVPNITHKLIYAATEAGKLIGLRQLLHPTSRIDNDTPLRPPFLVFTQTIERAQSLHDELKYDIPAQAGGSTRIAVLHSSLSDSVRSKIMARFRAGEIWVLITTDVLARGVDFVGVNGVVNYDVPTSAAAYVHRAGRTGRAGRAGGVAVTYYTKDDIPFIKSVANVIAASEKQAGKKADGGGVQKWLLDALPDVKKEDRRKLKARGIESRRAGGKATISTKSSWEKRKANNLKGAIEASKRRKKEALEAAENGSGDDGEWEGLDD
ncbi:P-loop containing nucleoside triphosphate hydrolase protein [Thozetella sp. PMI_491]|nr:P-loop containing nucleoside triphosphate hydrolase protein [Thozetella sp. PMI_491]